MALLPGLTGQADEASKSLCLQTWGSNVSHCCVVLRNEGLRCLKHCISVSAFQAAFNLRSFCPAALVVAKARIRRRNHHLLSAAGAAG